MISLDKFPLKCEICGSGNDVFFAHYEKHLEKPGYISICRSCHTSLHGKKIPPIQVRLDEYLYKVHRSKGIAEMAIYRYWKEVTKE